MADQDNISFELLRRRLAEIDAMRAELTRVAPLHGGGGGGTFEGMEAKVAVLEADVRALKEGVGEIKQKLDAVLANTTELRIDAARLDERVKHVPTLLQMLAALTGMLALIAAITVYQDNLKRAFSPSQSFSPTITVPAPTPRAP